MTTQVLEKPGSPELAKAERTCSTRCYCPNVDILERTDELIVLADMPGVKADDVDIQFENGSLTIFGKVQRSEPKEGQIIVREYGVGDYVRTFRVSKTVDSAGITAAFADGVLTLHLPKVEAVKPRKIQVKAD